MNAKLKEKILAEAVRIGEDLYNRRFEDDKGIYWETIGINYGDGTKFIWNVSDSIYSGICGIVLYYLALYKVTNEKKYLDICKNAIKRVIYYIKKDAIIGYSFITGGGGIAYTLMKLDEVCKGEYIDEALELMKDCEAYISKSSTPCEYLNGASGTLLVLVHLYNYSKEEWLLEKIDKYIKFIVGCSHYNFDGAHWDRNSHTIKSLCGLSHGNAGIGYVFLELGHFFKNSVFYYIAEQAFLYESKHYRSNEKNWLDLRKSFITEHDKKECEKAIESKNYKYFYDEKFMNAWCHGYPGIGLTRIRAYELTGKDIYKEEYETGLDNLLVVGNNSAVNSTSFTLCHGVGGNLDTVIEGQRVFPDNKKQEILGQITESMLYAYEENKFYVSGYFHYTGKVEDTSLFNGISGIGYYYLRIIYPEIVESILLPSIRTININQTDKKYSNINISEREIKQMFIGKHYSSTTKLMEKLFNNEYEEYFNKPIEDSRVNILAGFKAFVENLINQTGRNSELLKDIYLLESEKLQLDSEMKSYSLANHWYITPKKDVEELLKNEKLLMESVFRMNPDTRLYESIWDWSNIITGDFENIENEEKNPTLLLLIASAYGVKVEKISQFCYYILDNFKQREKVSNVVSSIQDLFEDSKNDSKKSIIENKVIEQIKSLMKEGILIND